MKKAFLGIIIFAVVSFFITGALIRVKINTVGEINNSQTISGDESKVDNIEDEVDNNETENTEKTIDLYGTYDENDLEFFDVTVNVSSGGSFSFPMIKGLKNKEVEKKINDDMLSQVANEVFVEEIKQKIKNGEASFEEKNVYDISSNFSNVISIMHDENYFNYELVNGNKLKFEDLFVKNADLQGIVRRMLYRGVSKNAENAGETFIDRYFDREKNEWIQVDYNYDWETRTDSEIESVYVPSLTDYEISKKIKSFFSDDDKPFYFTPTRIHIFYENNNSFYDYDIEFKDIADQVVIYDKYVTEESLYESSEIGTKNLWTCSEKLKSLGYANYGFATENLYYDISMRAVSDYTWNVGPYPFSNSLKTLEKEIIKTSEDKIKEYINIAEKNPDKFYVLHIVPELSYYYDENGNSYILSSKISEYFNGKKITGKEETMDDILDCYRYYNLVFYSSALEYGGYAGKKDGFETFEEKHEEKIYDARTLKEIVSVGEIFKPGIDYMNIIKDKMKAEIRFRKPELYENELTRMVDTADYKLEYNGIKADVPGYDSKFFVVYFYEFDKELLNIYDLDMFILAESASRKLDKSEIQNLTKDELNKAYNEIFARHGHDFKTASLKEYFESLFWYNAIENKTVTLEELSEIEKYNANLIRTVIDSRP